MTAKETETSDHDLLIELKTTSALSFQNLRDDIKSLTDGTHDQLKDHEKRLRNLESTTVLDATYSPAHAALIEQIEGIKKYIWMGMGVVSVLVIIVNVGIRFIK